jgi:hypothetical protein
LIVSVIISGKSVAKETRKKNNGEKATILSCIQNMLLSDSVDKSEPKSSTADVF